MFKHLIGFLLPVNRWTRLSVILFILGLILSPVIIGIPIMALAWMMLTLSTLIAGLSLLPGGKQLIQASKDALIKYWHWYQQLFKEAFKK